MGIGAFSDPDSIKTIFAFFFFGMSLYAVPQNYHLNFVKLVFWLGIVITLFIFTQTESLASFICILVFSLFAKLAGLDLHEESDNDVDWDID